VFLHGIGASGAVWEEVAGQLNGEPVRVIAFDLLGFGQSPKPVIKYNADEQARAVIKAMSRHKVRKPVMLVGHSMGSLIAARIARIRPDLVQHLILYQMPVYEGLPERGGYRLRRDFYFKLYDAIVDDPTMLLGSSMRAVVLRKAGVSVTPETLQPFARSLRHTIMEQSVLSDLSHIKVPIDVIYGSLDVLVIRGKAETVFTEVPAPLRTHTITQLHRLTPRASKFIAKRITAAAVATR